jgi:thiol:disulfide interchange protein DsbD
MTCPHSRLLRLLLLWLLCGTALFARAAEEFLEPERAFPLSARSLDAHQVELVFDVAPGYYLYRDKFKFAAAGAALGDAVLPNGKTKFDETFQKNVETHRGEVRIVLPVNAAGREFRLDVASQGCADRGLCYPPQEQALMVSLTAFGGDGSVRIVPVSSALGVGPAGAAASPGTASQASSGPLRGSLASVATEGAGALTGQRPTGDAPAEAALRGGGFWTVVGVFFVAGLLLSFTPCVLPMLPILSSLIAGQGADITRLRGFALAASYSLGMALVYTAFGIAAGLVGEGLAAALQTPWVLGAFAAGLLALAASMFGFFELQLPSAMHGHVQRVSHRLPAGRIAGVFAMGGVSALLVSPCVVAPLAGALVYLSQTRDVMLGGTALFSLAGGMSVPLLVLGASEGALLPRAGPWMEGVKQFFGWLLVGVAIWTVQPVVPAALALAAWGALLVGSAVALVRFRHAGRRPLWRWVACAGLVVFGLLQIVGAASGGSDPLQPLAHLGGDNRNRAIASSFVPVRSVAELDELLRTPGRPVMLDFYADWCVSCKEMERFTFADAAVQARLARALLLRADVTANAAADRELLKRFQLFGPPGTLFFDVDGRELRGTRVIGFQNAEQFQKTLQAAGL